MDLGSFKSSSSGRSFADLMAAADEKRAKKLDEISRETRSSQIMHARYTEGSIARMTPLYYDAADQPWRARAILSFPRDSWTRPEVSKHTHAFPLIGTKPIDGCWETCCGSLVYGRNRPGPLRAWITCDVCVADMTTYKEGCDDR